MTVLLRPFVQLLSWISDKSWSNAPARVIHGLDVRVRTTDADPAEALRAVEAGLVLIGQIDPRRHRRIRQDLRRVIVSPASRSWPARFVPATRTCYLRVTGIVGRPAVAVAVLLVHEATHARIHAAGAAQLGSRRDRAERLCVKEELTFLAKLPPESQAGVKDWIERRSRQLLRFDERTG